MLVNAKKIKLFLSLYIDQKQSNKMMYWLDCIPNISKKNDLVDVLFIFRILWLEGIYKENPIQLPYTSSMLLRALSKCFLNTNRHEASITSLGSLDPAFDHLHGKGVSSVNFT